MLRVHCPVAVPMGFQHMEEQHGETVLLRIVKTVEERFRCVRELAELYASRRETLGSQPQSFNDIVMFVNVVPFFVHVGSAIRARFRNFA